MVAALELLDYGGKIHELERRLRETKMSAWMVAKNSVSGRAIYESISKVDNVRVVVIDTKSCGDDVVSQAAIVVDTDMGVLSFPVELDEQNSKGDSYIWKSSTLRLIKEDLRNDILTTVGSMGVDGLFVDKNTLL